MRSVAQKAGHSATRFIAGTALASCLACWGSASQASLLNLTLNPFPDTTIGFIDFSYNGDTDAFTADGFSEKIRIDAGAALDLDAFDNFTLTASIDEFGVLTGGSFTVSGNLASAGFTTGTLLTGDLIDFGFDANDDLLEFKFDVTGGAAASLYNGIGSIGGIIFDQTGFGGSFANTGTVNFGSGAAVADIGAVPLPAAAWFMGAGLIGLLTRIRKQS